MADCCPKEMEVTIGAHNVCTCVCPGIENTLRGAVKHLAEMISLKKTVAFQADYTEVQNHYNT